MGAVSASVFGPHFVSLKLKNGVRDSSKQTCGHLIPTNQKTTCLIVSGKTRWVFWL